MDFIPKQMHGFMLFTTMFYCFQDSSSSVVALAQQCLIGFGLPISPMIQGFKASSAL